MVLNLEWSRDADKIVFALTSGILGVTVGMPAMQEPAEDHAVLSQLVRSDSEAQICGDSRSCTGGAAVYMR